ncbi:MAG: FAD-binding protein [Thermoproteota archaeon]|nr:FAD-binding protein [Thermoproteota archaeon]
MTSKNNDYKISSRSCDVLIIGGGSAGLRAAIEAHDAGSQVLIVSKSRRGDPHTVLARGGINAALGTMDPQDNWMIHATDTLREGLFIADYDKVEVLCKSATDAVTELVKWGARFHREPDGRLTQRFFGAHTYRRTCFSGDWTGKEIIRVLMKQVGLRKIKFVDNVYIMKLLKSTNIEKTQGVKEKRKEKEEEEKEEILGAMGIDLKRKKIIIIFKAKCVILATGGYTSVYPVSSSRVFENYGDGVALAYEAGVDLVDMEMVQFHPTGMVWPKKAVGTLATEAIRGEGGILLNSRGERFMKNYYPQRMELGPRDVVARSIYNEIVSGRGTKHGGVWLDVTHLPKAKILERLPTMYDQFKRIARVDISKEKMEVAPTAHYSMGGVKVDLKCQTNIRGLFAVGEVAGQVHGANRLGGNSLLETVVFGKIAGREAATKVAREKKKTINGKSSSSSSILEITHNEDNRLAPTLFAIKQPLRIHRQVQQIMHENAGIIREASKLRKGIKKISELEKMFYSKNSILKSFKKYENIVSTWEVKSALVVCEAVLRSALMRQESRGAHYRSDFPIKDDRKWKVNIYCRKSGREMVLFKRPVSKVREPIKDLLKVEMKVEHHLLE